MHPHALLFSINNPNNKYIQFIIAEENHKTEMKL